MTYRQIITSLAVGESHQFPSIEAAQSAACAAQKLYNGWKFSRCGNVVVRVA